jgi:hypothetical protein
MNKPSLSAPIHSLTTLSSSKCMMVTAHSSTARPVGARLTYPPVSVPRNVTLKTTVSQATIKVLDVQVKIRKRLAVAADRFDSGRGSYPKRIAVFLAVEISGRFVVSAIPDLVKEPPHLQLALGNVHRWPPCR